MFFAAILASILSAAQFADPPAENRPECWWWFPHSMTERGMTHDLEAMKRAGIDRAYIGDISGDGNDKGPVKTFSPEWNASLNAAFDEASKQGVEIGLFNSPGWSQSGGPWVKPEMAMRRFVSSIVAVDGPKDGGIVLPPPEFEGAPPEDARDFAVVA